ncbi:VOC family protein [Leucobacter denitrificans]|uniref:VOC family protein n=1 Tax=Leucobacter denitrificans TaxID=683042 RepID=A0A7G9S3E0_9MICO|nr:VOC family protein [Leucobacter denitrificans]QNN62365.1 VOC family protein [Leucobacter denitrificans]
MGIRPATIGHIGLVAQDVDRLVDFYCRILGMEVSDWLPFPESSPYDKGAWLRCNTEHHVVSIFGLKGEAPTEAAKGQPGTWSNEKDNLTAKPGLHHIAFELSDFEDLRRAAKICRKEGLTIQGMRKGGPGSQLRMYFWDPENNLIELFWAMDQIGWDGVTRTPEPIEEIDIETFDIKAWIREKGSMYRFAATNYPLDEAE